MGLNLKEQISSLIRSLPNIEQKHDPMSEEAYFYGEKFCPFSWTTTY
jgi:hypothetical protein